MKFMLESLKKTVSKEKLMKQQLLQQQGNCFSFKSNHFIQNILYLQPLVNTFHNGKSENSYTGVHKHPVIPYCWQESTRQCKHTCIDSNDFWPT